MELRQVRYCLAVADELSFTKAAERLHISEQPMGRQIRKLEGELGFAIFERTTRSVRVTPAGAEFLERASRAIDQLEVAAESARRVALGMSGTVRLGYASSLTLSVLPDFVKLFAAEYPEINLMLHEDTNEGLDPLEEGEVEASLVVRYSKLPRWVEFIPMAHDRAVVALPLDHPLLQKSEVSMADLAGERFLGYEGAAGGRGNAFVASLAQWADADVEVVPQGDSYLPLIGFVAARFGLTILTEGIAKTFPQLIGYRPLANPAVGVEYGLAFRKGGEPSTAGALRTVAKHYASIA